MALPYTAVMKHKGDWGIGWMAEVPGVNGEERSKAALTATLRITLREALAWHRQAARAAAGEGYEEAVIAL
jgi:hypothetical protein